MVYAGIEKSENIADISKKYRISGGIETIIVTDYRSTEKSAKNRQNRRYIGEISVKHRFIGEKSRVDLMRGATRGEFKKIAENIVDILVFLPIFRKISGYFLPVQPAHRIQNLAQKSWI